MPDELRAGRTHEIRREITADLTAHALGNTGVTVFGTPCLVLLVEELTHECVRPFLAAGLGTVGTRVDVRHLAATPVGMTVTARCELIEVDGRRLVFRVEAHDEVEPIASGTHERFIISSVERFVQRAENKRLASEARPKEGPGDGALR